ncbi:hypothetical protein EJ04DRAFT_287360 [Polyplosphaeria fusca]|uniref:Uncharacterized protein n=1 Tax=Polyplosphaeria fusca TaxID=682080 RepID=A0A9P4R5W4_9PLEO|nr:hypothetical protein EJ04DRAFT_287360 [Polyplosphaeria fusca]
MVDLRIADWHTGVYQLPVRSRLRICYRFTACGMTCRAGCGGSLPLYIVGSREHRMDRGELRASLGRFRIRWKGDRSKNTQHFRSRFCAAFNTDSAITDASPTIYSAASCALVPNFTRNKGTARQKCRDTIAKVPPLRRDEPCASSPSETPAETLHCTSAKLASLSI